MNIIRPLSIGIFSLVTLASIAFLFLPPTGFTPTDFLFPVADLLFMGAFGFFWSNANSAKQTLPSRVLKASGLALVSAVAAVILWLLIAALVGYLHGEGVLSDSIISWP